jgi:transposase
MSYINSDFREQIPLTPICLDDMIDRDNPCRIIDAFCERLDMKRYGFKSAETAGFGRPPYDPRELLKLILYGHMNRISSSGQLVKETTRNIEVMWLIRNLHPKKRVLYYFKENNADAIKEVTREFNSLYKKLRNDKSVTSWLRQPS